MCLQVVLDFLQWTCGTQFVVVPIFSTLVWIPEIPLWLCVFRVPLGVCSC